MSDESRPTDDAFVERIGRVLGAREQFDDHFEQTLIDAIRADRPLRRTIPRHVRPLTPAWWSTPATVRVSPLRTVLLAAGVAAIAALGTLRLANTSAIQQSRIAATTHDTVTLVRF